jgi:hypothetical protein
MQYCIQCCWHGCEAAYIILTSIHRVELTAIKKTPSDVSLAQTAFACQQHRQDATCPREERLREWECKCGILPVVAQ